MSKLSQFAAACAAVVCAFGAVAQPFYQCEMTVGGYAGSTALENFSVLVRISPERIGGFTYGDCQPNGADISFADMDGNVLAHEVDTWNAEGESLVWVKLPTLSGKETKFRFRWCDATPPANDPKAVWTDYIGVWHFNALVDSMNISNSARNDYDLGFSASGVGSIVANAPTGKGLFCETGTVKTKDYEPEFAVGSKFTVTGWFHLPSFEGTSGKYAGIVSKKVGLAWNANTGWYLQMNQSKTTIGLVESGSMETRYSSLPDVTKNWNHFALISDGSAAKAYFNGSSSPGINRSTEIKASSTEFQVGTSAGYVDEYRLRKGTVSTDWACAEYATVANADYIVAGETEILSTKAILMSSNGPRYGEVSPAYGRITEPEDGKQYVFSCTVATQMLNNAGTTRAVCTGWKLCDLASGELLRSSEEQGEEPFVCRHTYADDKGVSLVWQWAVEYKVTASAKAGGSVEPTEQWVRAGQSATVTATEGEGMRFLGWIGDVSRFDAVTTLDDVQKPLALTAEFGDADQRVVYVATTGEDGEGNGSAAAPYATMNAAVAALGTLGTATGTVVVAEGDYELTDTLRLTNAVRIVGAGMYKTTLKGTLIKGVNGVKAGSRGVYLNHAGAWMGGLTVTECSSKGLDGSGIYMDKGTLDGVRSYANRSGLGEYTTPNPGVGLYMAGGLATNCVIEANVQDGGYGARYGAGLAISSGLFTDGKVLNNVCNRNQSSGLGVHVCGASAIVRNSLIMGNNAGSYQPGDQTYGMGVFMTQNGLVENCRIVGNSVQGVYMTSGTLRNCLVTGHENSSTSYSAGVDVRGDGKVINCTIWGNTAANKFSGLYSDNANAQVVNNIVWGNGTSGDIKVSDGVCNTNVVGSTLLISTAKAVGNVTSDPLFANPSADDFTFGNKSPASDKAAPRTDVTRDLVGTKRPQNAGPDIGCFECAYEITGLEVSVAVSKTDWNVGERIVAEATVFGATGPVTFKWSVDGVVYEDATEATATFDGLGSGRHVISVEVSDGVQTASGSTSDPVSVKPTVVYVNDATGDDAANFPYDDATKPAKTVNVAFDALGRAASNTTTVHIASGTYALTKELVLDTPCQILGAGMRATVLDGEALPKSARCLSLSAAGSRVVGLTLRNCKTLIQGAGLRMSADGWVEDVLIYGNEIGKGGGSTPASGAGLWQSAGVVTNCVIENNSQNSTYGTGEGAGVYISGGTLVDSVVTNNWRDRNQLLGAGVRASGSAKVIRCTIAGNSNKQGSFDAQTYGMGLYMSGGTVADCVIVNNGRQGVYASGGTLRNCLIAGSKTAPAKTMYVPDGWAGGLQLTGATVINCTVGGNLSADAEQNDLRMTSGKFQSSIAQYAVVTGGTLTHSLTNANPCFRSPAHGDFRLRASSPAVNAGDWTLFGKTKDEVRSCSDLSGESPRLLGSEIDMGCYEKLQSGIMLIVR